MHFRFTKMHGLGNDFVVIDAINQQVKLTESQVKFLADRHFGIGCDQLLIVETSSLPEADFFYRIYNADGGEVGQCGNGARCFARFVHEKKLSDKTIIPVETASGLIELHIREDGQVRVDMGVPDFDPRTLPFEADEVHEYHDINVEGEQYSIGAVSMGNPHAVLLIDDINEAPVESLGPALESHQRFPQRVNVGFMEIVDRTHINLRVFERGAGETLACGTGACAAAAVGIRNRLLDNKVIVHLSGGELEIEWQGHGQPLYMTGPATTVFEGEVSIE